MSNADVDRVDDPELAAWSDLLSTKKEALESLAVALRQKHLDLDSERDWLGLNLDEVGDDGQIPFLGPKH